jgi:subtilisin family serine protease
MLSRLFSSLLLTATVATALPGVPAFSAAYAAAKLPSSTELSSQTSDPSVRSTNSTPRDRAESNSASALTPQVNPNSSGIEFGNFPTVSPPYTTDRPPSMKTDIAPVVSGSPPAEIGGSDSNKSAKTPVVRAPGYEDRNTLSGGKSNSSPDTAGARGAAPKSVTRRGTEPNQTDDRLPTLGAGNNPRFDFPRAGTQNRVLPPIGAFGPGPGVTAPLLPNINYGAENTMRPPLAIPNPEAFYSAPAVPNPGTSSVTEINPPPRVIRPLPPAGPRRAGSGVPPANENRFAPNEVVIEVVAATNAQAIAALEQRHAMAPIEQLASQLSATTLLRARIQDGRTVAAVVRELETDAGVMAAQPNYRFTLQLETVQRAALNQPVQYAVMKLRLEQAHELANGSNVLVAVIDSGIDISHPELNGTVAASLDAIEGARKSQIHGTAIAGLIAAHAKLVGSAPAARILAVRAFDSASDTPEGSTFGILKGLDWAAVNGARIINMSFAGPSDPAIHRGLEAAYKNAIVLIAAAGNAGPKSPPLFPAADPSVIAVTATDADDRVFSASNRGAYISLAAPGVDLLVAAPSGGYQISSGTSLSAAEVSGIVALMLQRSPNLTVTAVRSILLSTGRVIPLDKVDSRFGPRLTDALQAVSVNRPPLLPAAMR